MNRFLCRYVHCVAAYWYESVPASRMTLSVYTTKNLRDGIVAECTSSLITARNQEQFDIYRGAWFIESWLKFDGESRPSAFRWRLSHELQTVSGWRRCGRSSPGCCQEHLPGAHSRAPFPWCVASLSLRVRRVCKRGAAAGQKASEIRCNFSHLVRTSAFMQVILLGTYCK